MSNLQTYYHFKLDFQKVDQHTGGKWLIHGTKRRKDMMIWIKPTSNGLWCMGIKGEMSGTVCVAFIW